MAERQSYNQKKTEQGFNSVKGVTRLVAAVLTITGLYFAIEEAVYSYDDNEIYQANAVARPLEPEESSTPTQTPTPTSTQTPTQTPTLTPTIEPTQPAAVNTNSPLTTHDSSPAPADSANLQDAINYWCAQYGVSCQDMNSIAQCESSFGQNPNAYDNIGNLGPFQFDEGTWLDTPPGQRGESVFDNWASAEGAAWMIAQSRRDEWPNC